LALLSGEPGLLHAANTSRPTSIRTWCITKSLSVQFGEKQSTLPVSMIKQFPVMDVLCKKDSARMLHRQNLNDAELAVTIKRIMAGCVIGY